MDKEKENSKNMQEKGTENPSTNHLLPSDNSMKAKAKVSSEISGEVSENRKGRTPASDNFILCKILCRLQTKYLMRFKSVSTQWKSLIERDSFLIDSHYRYHSRELNGSLLFISSPPPPKSDEPRRVGGTIDFKMVLPLEAHKLELDRSKFGIPKQSVAGLLCITTGRVAFLIYNPSTGERTPWIVTTTVNENIGGSENVGGKEEGREVDCIAFGYSPTTKEHKVLCISSVKKKGEVRAVAVEEERQVFCIQKCDGKQAKIFEHDDGEEEAGVDEEQVCEVFTVGENTWRRIDAVPPYSLASKICYVGDVNTYNEECKSVYVDGKIYWRFRYTRKGEVIMVFDVTTEKFSVISIPGYVTETPWKYPQTVELLEVDGHIAVLNFAPGCLISLWILHQGDGGYNWSYEKVKTSCGWDGVQDLSIADISGKNGIFMKLQGSEAAFIYDRVGKVCLFHKVNQLGLNYQAGELREIFPLVDSIARVTIKPCSMF